MVDGDAVEAESESVDRSFDAPLPAYSALLRMCPAADLTSFFHTLLGGLDKCQKLVYTCGNLRRVGRIAMKSSSALVLILSNLLLTLIIGEEP